MAKLSVIVACHNNELTADITLQSLKRQALDSLEIILINDASKDGTGELCEDWAGLDPRIRLFHNTKNLGCGGTRNKGLSLATGDFVTFIDGDDWVSRDYFGELVKTAEQNELDFVRCDHTRVTGTLRAVVRAPEPRRYETLAPNDCILPVAAPSMVDYPYAPFGVYRRSFLHEHGIEMSGDLLTAEDRVWVWRLYCEGTRTQCISEAGYCYRRDESAATLTSIGDVRQLAFLQALERILDYLEARDAPDLWLAKAYRQVLSLAAFHYDKRERLEPRVLEELEIGIRKLLRRLEGRILVLAADRFDARRAEMLTALSGRAIPSLP